MNATGMVRTAETVIRTIGGRAVKLRLRTAAGEVAGEVVVDPVLVRREKKSDGQRGVELLIPAAALKRTAESCGASSTRALVESVLGASVGNAYFRKTMFTVDYAFGDEYLWRISAIE